MIGDYLNKAIDAVVTDSPNGLYFDAMDNGSLEALMIAAAQARLRFDPECILVGFFIALPGHSRPAPPEIQSAFRDLRKGVIRAFSPPKVLSDVPEFVLSVFLNSVLAHFPTYDDAAKALFGGHT